MTVKITRNDFSAEALRRNAVRIRDAEPIAAAFGNGLSASERMRVRQEQSAPLVADLKAWLGEERSRLSRSASVVKPIDYLLKRWDRFVCFLDDGRICVTTGEGRSLNVVCSIDFFVDEFPY